LIKVICWFIALYMVYFFSANLLKHCSHHSENERFDTLIKEYLIAQQSLSPLFWLQEAQY
ncbi:MAG TPA: hypothetical protein VE944_10530, partial [Nostoc sp.]|uniref:hypothetical protein n=1 Tax=Nostoc sp. TaxID=1180 RepID=UPI002D4C5C55